MCIRPHEGVASNKVSPVIRPPGKPTVLMMPLDLAANDYLKRPGTTQQKLPTPEPFKLPSPEKKAETVSKEVQTLKEEHTESFFNRSQYTDFEVKEQKDGGESLAASIQEDH